MIKELAKKLSLTYGRGFDARTLFRMVRFAKFYPQEEIVVTLSPLLSWSHFVELIAFDDPLRRQFYTEMCRLEHWSVRELRKKIAGMLYERTAISQKPEAAIKQDLEEISYKTANTPNEFEGSIQIPDTERILKTKQSEKRLVELIAERLRSMCSVRPVIGNIIAILLAGIALYYIFNEIKEPWFVKYQDYFGIGIQLFAALQIIKSGSRSLILPVLALVGGGIASHSLSADQTLFHFGKAFFEHLTIVGVIGAGISILNID